SLVRIYGSSSFSNTIRNTPRSWRGVVYFRRPTCRSTRAFGIAALLYLAISFTLVWLFRQAERRWLAYLRPQGK
ncbi:MAG: hypothetical protein VB141_04995, partial [Burkholderia gladioli]